MCVVRRAVTTYLDRFAIFLAFLISLDKFFKYLSKSCKSFFNLCCIDALYFFKYFSQESL